MVSLVLARTVIGIIGNIIALFLFLSPLPTFVTIWKRGSVEQYSPIPYLATLVNCLVWVLYGLPVVHPGSILVITINAAGTLIELVYIILFFVFSDRKKRMKVLLVLLIELVFITVLTLLVLFIFHTHSKRSMVVGTICILFNIGMYASPLAVMNLLLFSLLILVSFMWFPINQEKLVIKTKSVEYMPLSLSVASFANGVAWTIYALLPLDPYILIPNGLGTLFGLAQLILYASFYKSTKLQKEEREGKGQVVLSDQLVTNGKECWKNDNIESGNPRAEVHGA
ncbi:bidirectional sugar transporter SWEET7 isoform X1 [Cucumis sativus]|uniref:bidirectional sugar transporter SWEET7 isoform X1 n=1 Tax=Cucumis sativus TaxID=3659 RepID=UPI0012F48132|nr:bidirectional sugar transporter SWEET7 isoform X1 [Cucumis sativus]